MHLRVLNKTATAAALAYLAATFATGCSGGAGGTSIAPVTTTPAISELHSPLVQLNKRDQQWLQFGYSPGHSGYNPLEKTINAANVSSLQLAWNDSNIYEAQGIVASGNELYVTEGGQSNGGLYAINAANGKQKWYASLGLNAGWADNNPIAVIANGVVVSPCSNDSPTAFATGFCGVKETNGKVLWTYYCTGGYYGFGCASFGANTPPALYHNTVFVQIPHNGEQPDTQALDPKTGAVEWSIPGVGHCPDSGGPGTALPAANGDVFAVLGCAGTQNKTEVCALSATSGTAAWCDVTLAAYTLALIAGGGNVYMVEPNQTNGNSVVVALNAKTGAQVWTATIPGWNYAALATANDRVFVEDGKAGVYALSSKTGKTLWSYTESYNNNFQGGVISVANGLVYTDGGQGNNGNSTLTAFNEKTGAVAASFNSECNTGGPAPLVILKGAVYGGATLCAFTLPAKRQ